MYRSPCLEQQLRRKTIPIILSPELVNIHSSLSSNLYFSNKRSIVSPYRPIDRSLRHQPIYPYNQLANALNIFASAFALRDCVVVDLECAIRRANRSSITHLLNIIIEVLIVPAYLPEILPAFLLHGDLVVLVGSIVVSQVAMAGFDHSRLDWIGLDWTGPELMGESAGFGQMILLDKTSVPKSTNHRGMSIAS